MLPHSRLLLRKLLNYKNFNKITRFNNGIVGILHNKIRNYQTNHLLQCKKGVEANEEEANLGNDNSKKTVAGSQKYAAFREEDSFFEIFDVDEERLRLRQELPPVAAPSYDNNDFHGLNLKRGVKSVFDIEDLVDVLHKENAEDVFVCSVPKSLNYVDYLVICSGRSYRHMLAIAEFVRRMFKIKRHKTDIMPRIEGKQSRNWMAIDLGNIALHIMTAEARETYDLESLWAVGAEFDNEFNKPKDPLVELFEKHMVLMADVQANQNAKKNSNNDATSQITTATNNTNFNK